MIPIKTYLQISDGKGKEQKICHEDVCLQNVE